MNIFFLQELCSLQQKNKQYNGSYIMKSLTRKIKKYCTFAILDFLPRPVKDKILREFISLDYNLPDNIEFKLAETKDEFEQAFSLLYEGYLKSGSMAPDPSGLRITKYHILPASSVVIACKGGKVIATASIFRDSDFGIPADKEFNLSQLNAAGHRIAEISSLCVDDEYNKNSRHILFALIKYVYEYANIYFGVDIFIITIKKFRSHFYESIFNYQPTENRVVRNYSFSNGATVISRYLNLNEAKIFYETAYKDYPDSKNIYKYFIHTQIKNYKFPTRKYNTILTPKFSPELFEYFFIKKKQIIQNLSPLELTYLHDIYHEAPYLNLTKNISSPPLKRNYQRSAYRVDFDSKAIITFPEKGHTSEGRILNCTKNGILIHINDAVCFEEACKLDFKINSECNVNLYITNKWGNSKGYYGFEITNTDQAWENMWSELNPFFRF